MHLGLNLGRLSSPGHLVFEPLCGKRSQLLKLGHLLIGPLLSEGCDLQRFLLQHFATQFRDLPLRIRLVRARGRLQGLLRTCRVHVRLDWRSIPW